MDTLDSTLEELEGDGWGEPPYPSHLVAECHRLRKVQLRFLTIENLRIMLGQDIGSRHLVPIACAEAKARCKASRPGTSGQEHGPIAAKAIRKAYGAFIS